MHIKFMAIKVFLRNCMIVAEIILDMCHCNGIIWIVINILRTYCLSILHMFVLLFFVSYVIWAYQIIERMFWLTFGNCNLVVI